MTIAVDCDGKPQSKQIIYLNHLPKSLDLLLTSSFVLILQLKMYGCINVCGNIPLFPFPCPFSSMLFSKLPMTGNGML